MPSNSTVPRYSPVEQAFHWLTAVLVLVAFIYGPGGNEQRVYSAARDFDRQLHETLGLTVFVVSVLRLAWRPFDRRPEDPPMPRWMYIASRTVQVALYVLLFALPVSAVTGAWLEGHPLTLLGGAHVAPLLAKSHDLGSRIATVHTWLGDAIMWIAGLHAAAALFHHFVLRDRVLRSMLPGRG
jgi:cytochrome b561